MNLNLLTLMILSVTVNAVGVPDAPTALILTETTVLGAKAIQITFKNPVDEANIDHVEVWSSTDNVTYTQLLTDIAFVAGTADYTITDNTAQVVDDAVLYYQARAYNSGTGFNLLQGTITVSGSTFGLVADPSFQVARNATISVNKNAELDLQIKATRVTGVAPLGVVFDAITDSTFTGIARPLHEVSFWWDFGDVGATFDNIPVDHPFGNDANIARGGYTGHVFQEGSYTVKCYCFDHVTGNVGYAEVVITSTNIAAAFPTTQTVYLDPTSTWANSPVGANQVSTWAAMKTAMQVTGDRRLVVDYGAVIEVDAELDMRRAGVFRFHPVGLSTNGYPEFKPKVGVSLGLGMFYMRAGNLNKDIAFTELFGKGDYDPLTGTGEDYNTDFFNILESDFVTVWRCKGRGLNDNFVLAGNDTTLNKGGNVCQDNDFSDWKNFGSSGSFYDSIYRGNSTIQNPLAVSGEGGKGESGMIYTAPTDGIGTVVTYTHGVDMLSDANKNMAAGYKNNTTGAVTVLDTGTLTFTETTVDINVPSGNKAYIYFRRWADHGSIRLYNCQRQALVHNDMASYTGWSTSGAPAGEGAIQPNIRYNSATQDNASGVINSNRCKGGFSVIHSGDANGDSGDNYSIDLVIEDNHVTCDAQTRDGIAANQTGITVRNNVIFMPDVPESTAFRKLQYMVSVAAWTSATDPAENNKPVRVYNNTLVNLQTTANGAEDIDGVTGLAPEAGAIMPTDLLEANNLVYYPEFTPPNIDYSPINTVTGELLAGSPAIDAGTNVQQLVWDDFAGNVRGITNSIGSYDAAGVSQEVSFSGVAGSYADITPRVMVIGEKIKIEFKATGNTTYSRLLNLADTRFYTADRIRWNFIFTPVTLDGVAIASGSGYPEISDGLWHTLVFVMAAGSGSLTNIASANATTEPWQGSLRNLEVLSASDVTLLKYDMNSGNPTEAASIGSGTMTFHNETWA